MYDNVDTPNHDDAWRGEYFRISQIYRRGKKALGLGDEEIGSRVPELATKAGLDVFDVRLNDRALHLIPPYAHDKQKDYAEFLRQGIALDTSGTFLKYTTEIVQAGGGSEAEARWLYYAFDEPGQLKALEEGTLTMVNAYCLYLTFARKRGK
jgi:hypothetical protein